LIDNQGDLGDALFYSNPASIGSAYDQMDRAGPFHMRLALPPPARWHSGKRVSLRSMDQNMKDSSAQNFYLGVEHSLSSSFLLRVNYQDPLDATCHARKLQRYDATLMASASQQV